MRAGEHELTTANGRRLSMSVRCRDANHWPGSRISSLTHCVDAPVPCGEPASLRVRIVVWPRDDHRL